MTDERLTTEQERELRAMEAGAEGRPVEADLTELAQLAHDLAATRPTAAPRFAERLDRAVEDSFPPEWTWAGADDPRAGDPAHRRGRGTWRDRLRRRVGDGRRLLLPATAGLAGVLVVATAVVAGLDSRGPSRDVASEPAQELAVPKAPAGKAATRESMSAADSAVDAADGGAAASESGAAAAGGGVAASGARLDRAASRSFKTLASGQAGGRKVAAAAEITLGTDPDGVQEVANEVIEVVDDHNGIVMDSSVSDGEAGTVGAEFSLSIPSGQVESAIADLSGIADLRKRTQETEDITAPFNTTEDRLKTTRARIEGLLGELENAYTDEDRQRIERRLRSQRWTARHLQQRMNRLEKRVAMTPIAVSVVTGEDGSDDSGWGVGDALDDAGRLLGIAAGVALIALAISIPIGLMVLIVLAINRAWVRRARNRALQGE